MASLGSAVDSSVSTIAPKALNAGGMAVKGGKTAGKSWIDGQLRFFASAAHIAIPLLLGFFLGGPIGIVAATVLSIAVGYFDGVIWR